MNALAARDRCFSYAGRAVVSGVSLEVPAGEMLGIVGPNGSGKTTLLRLLSGVLRPSAGAVSVLGRPVVDYARRELAQLIAVVPQGGGTVFPYTVEEMVAMGRMPHLTWSGWLSGGERQRVLIARALAQEARIILLDEASSFLDLAQELGIFRTLDRLRREQGLTFVTVSHDLNLVGAFCSRVLLLRDGGVLASGPRVQTYTGANLSALFGVAVETADGPDGRVRVQW
jgi:iron complex transport system ATP-binding protein